MTFDPQLTPPGSTDAAPLYTHRTSDGCELAYRLWKTAGVSPRGQILALHGIQSHSGWYAASCRQLAAAGYEVWFPDRRGSGRNAQERGHVAGYERWLDDVNEFLSLMTQADTALPQGETIPRFLMGMSWGAKLALAHTAVRPYSWAGIVLLYPGVHTRVAMKPWQVHSVKMLYRLGLRRMMFSVPLDNSDLFTRRPESRRMIETDANALRRVSVSFLNATLQLDRLALAAPRHLHLPTFCQLAGDDHIVDNAKTRDLLQQLATDDSTIIEYPGARHTLEFEPNREEIVGDLLEWLNRLAPRPPGTEP